MGGTMRLGSGRTHFHVNGSKSAKLYGNAIFEKPVLPTCFSKIHLHCLLPPLRSSSYESRRLVRQVRWLLESGDIDSPIDLLHLHVSFVLNDYCLLFCLQKQKFIELMRRGTAEDRTALAPCALNAYPEAYEEFKHILLALIYGKNDLNSPFANEWSLRRRFEIAGFM